MSPARPYSVRLYAPLIAAAALALSACATTPYTGPVEVTRFVAADRSGLAQGPITLTFPDEVSNNNARTAFAAAVGAQLVRLGYTLAETPGPATQTAAIRTSRTPITAAVENQRGPVSVGVGGQTGGFGSGLGMGVGINLGGGREEPAAMTLLEVRIARADGTAVWEGRAQMATGIKSPYSQVDTSARTLTEALFMGFPGGNGEMVTVDVRKLRGTR